MTQFLADVDGQLCVCWQSVKYGEPKLTRSYFPIGIKTREFEANYYPLNEVDLISQGNAYGVLRKGGYYANALTLNLIDGGKTRSIKYEEIGIPCPKVRSGIKTRWSSSKERWEKELKSGWCTV